MASAARFRFHGSLNDFLHHSQKDNWISYTFRELPAIKDTIEAIGVPHPEVDVILVNGKAVNFTYKLQPDDVVEVYPAGTLQSINLIPEPKNPLRFVLDVHLGKLARLLRMLGFDTIYDPALSEKQIVGIALSEERILLTRGTEILKLKTIKYGYWLRSQDPEIQLREVITYYNLTALMFRLFSRCLVCNGEIKQVQKEAIQAQLPPKTQLYFHEFYQCSNCRRVYWKGSHFERMQEFIQTLREPEN
ncbi:Mut7-C RNAse domain-containing protein [Pontibacter sp. H259]|uniref:Mut7-C RNAse domain-containing protein n=1 Tax=Pontibacter sp. H259 TaxID=3133421 RepID=UPI0030C467F8